MIPAGAPASRRFFGIRLCAVRSSQNLHRFRRAVAQCLAGSMALAWVTFVCLRLRLDLATARRECSAWQPDGVTWLP
jgi:hypothetical protein